MTKVEQMLLSKLGGDGVDWEKKKAKYLAYIT